MIADSCDILIAAENSAFPSQQYIFFLSYVLGFLCIFICIGL